MKIELVHVGHLVLLVRTWGSFNENRSRENRVLMKNVSFGALSEPRSSGVRLRSAEVPDHEQRPVRAAAQQGPAGAADAAHDDDRE